MNLRTNLFNVIMPMVLLISCNTLFAQTGSVATADDYTATEINPAALYFGNASGLAFEGFFNEAETEDRYNIFFNRKSLAFVYGKDGSSNNYRLATSMPVFRNLYLGSDMYWLNSNIGDADYSLSSLFRPHNMLSLGLNIKEINRSKPGYFLGLGLRPFWGSGYLGDRITLTGDVSYTEKRGEGFKEVSWNKPVIGLETEFLNGISLKGRYDLESETIGIDFSIAFKQTRMGSGIHIDDNNDYTGGKYYFFMAQKDHRSLTPPLRRDNIYQYKMNKEIVDELEQRKFGPFIITKNQVTMEDTIEKIRTLKMDDSIQGIIFKNPELKTNFANLLELREELMEFRNSGKKIAVYGDNFGNLHYAFFASIADVMYLNPNGSVVLTGVSIAMPYFAETLDKLGIDVIDLRSHNYKTGLNVFTESEMTEAEVETYGAILDDYYDYLKWLIQEGRGHKISQDIERVIDQGPYLLSQDALSSGLVDKLIFEDEIEEEIKSLFSKPRIAEDMPNEKMTYRWAEPKEVKIAIIYATGSIVMSDGVPGRTIGGKTTARQIKKAREDSSVKGIILRINSGGGSAYASDLIAREIKKCREEGKPVVVSMGGAAASGGYYIAAYADRIVAEPTTITGSIGVTGMIPNFNRLFDKLAVNWSSVKRGERSDILAFYRPVKEEEITLLQDYIADSYDTFVSVVAEGRGMTYDEVHEIAQGRVWTGKRAKEIGLVDELGGMQEAKDIMKEIGSFQRIKLEDYSYKPKGFWLSLSMGGLFSPDLSVLNLPDEVNTLIRYKEMQDKWANERVLYLMPVFEIMGLE